ncbi:hypothetical protein D3C78_1699650 [compost metagenome]
MFNLGQQTLVILVLMMLIQLLMAVARWSVGASLPGLGYFLPALIGALLWPLLTKLMLLPYRSERH